MLSLGSDSRPCRAVGVRVAAVTGDGVAAWSSRVSGAPSVPTISMPTRGRRRWPRRWLAIRARCRRRWWPT